MRVLCLTLVFVAGSAMAQESDEPAAAPASPAGDVQLDCKKPASFVPLFEASASASASSTSTESSESLAQANEDAFLKCPRTFLVALKDQPRETQDSVLSYFGIRHTPVELGKELRKLKNDPQVGPIVRTRFTVFLDAKESK